MFSQKFALIIIISMLFTGCNHYQEQENERQRRSAQREQDIHTAHKECTDTLDAVKNKLLTDYQKCVQPKFRRIFLENDNIRDTDIFELLMARRMLIASKLDAKKITPEEADVESSEADLQFSNERRRRALIEYNMTMESLRNESEDRREIIEQFNRNRDRSTTTNCYKTFDGGISCTTR